MILAVGVDILDVVRIVLEHRQGADLTTQRLELFA